MIILNNSRVEKFPLVFLLLNINQSILHLNFEPQPVFIYKQHEFNIERIFSIRILENIMRSSDQNISIRRKPRAVSTFLKKTYQLLKDQQTCDVVRWAPNGIGFIVLNQDAFSKEILPKYFKHSNYSSFVRQLNMYNFHKIRQNNSQSYFHHQCFDRFNQQKLAEIKRKPQKKKRKNDESDEELLSDIEQGPSKQNTMEIKLKPYVANRSELKVQDQKNTRHFFSQQCQGDGQWKPVEQGEDDKISINNDMSQRILPRLATRELIYPSNNNLFPFGGKGQTSTFCLFF